MSNPLSVRRVLVQTIDKDGKPVGEPSFGVMASDTYRQCYNDTFHSLAELNKEIEQAPSILAVGDNGSYSDEADHDKIKKSLDKNGNFYGKNWMNWMLDEEEQSEEPHTIELACQRMYEGDPETLRSAGESILQSLRDEGIKIPLHVGLGNTRRKLANFEDDGLISIVIELTNFALTQIDTTSQRLAGDFFCERPKIGDTVKLKYAMTARAEKPDDFMNFPAGTMGKICEKYDDGQYWFEDQEGKGRTYVSPHEIEIVK